ncbi:uncharacterized protein LOC133785203 [Humulus lupulus]|uniref:uncharacterized protein LOC133785203 n=1 Tax=Humulus lupulus TaxID=3486 RepID=UPI002B40AF41|nr:uncharacterized protein LOC133785203 [Humulus lupulus]
MVLGANPPLPVFEGFFKRVWGHLGIAQIARMTMGLVMVKFNDEATRSHVLENGCLHFYRKPVIVRPWTTDLNAICLIRSVPLWIRLHDLGLQYWGSNCLSALVSTIGKPIMVDKFTQERTRVQFARVLVEMELSDNPPRIIHYMNEFGQLVEQGVDYEWLPVKCKNCGSYGHVITDCRKDQKTQLDQKVTESRIPQDQGREKNNQLLTSSTEKATERSKSWNIRGLNSPKKQDVVLDTCSKNKIRIGAILENKMKVSRVQEVMDNKFRNWDYYTSPVIEGRILLIWRKVFVKVSVLEENAQFVHCLVKMTGHKSSFNITFVYGRNTLEERKALWNGLAQIVCPTCPWMVLGDFNAIFTARGRNGGKSVSSIEIVDPS